MHNDLISVIVPVYNCENDIYRCIKSILKQTYKNIEILIINDGSTDNSEKIIKSIEDKRIIYITKKNTGVSDTRNLGINRANGKYILFVDADDYLFENMIEITYKEICENEVDVVRANYYIKKNNQLSKSNECDFSNRVLNKKEIKEKVIPEILEHKIRGYVWLLLIKKEKIKEGFSRELNILEDMKFYIDLFFNIDKAIFLNDGLYVYNCDNKYSATKNYDYYEKNMYNMVKATLEIQKSLEKNEFYDKIAIEKFITKNINTIINYNYLLYKSGYDLRSIKKNWKKLKNKTDYKMISCFYNSKYNSMIEQIIYILLQYECYAILINIFYIRKNISQKRRKV